MTRNTIRNIILSGVLLFAVSCSTTRRLPEGEILYTGMKVQIEKSDSAKVPSGVASAVSDAVDVAPNNYIKMLHWRYPFPLGLWVYNNWPNPPSGFRHWLYEKLVSEPVLVSDVRPEVRTHMIEQILDNNGYFSGTATYSLVQGRNPRKAKIKYVVNPGPAYPISSIELLPDSTPLNHLIDSLARQDIYLSATNPRFCTDSLSIARTRITNSLRNRGITSLRPISLNIWLIVLLSPEKLLLK